MLPPPMPGAGHHALDCRVPELRLALPASLPYFPGAFGILGVVTGSPRGMSNTSLLVLFTAHDQDPMLPVSREEYLRARIHKLDRDAKRAGANVTKTPYQQWMDGAAQRKKDLDQMLARISDRDLAEKTRAGFEKQERETAENLKASEPRDVETKSFDPAGRLRDQLAAMTPQERTSQAWAAGTDIMPAGAPGALRVVRVDPAFLRARGSAADALAILVILREPPPALVEARRSFIATSTGRHSGDCSTPGRRVKWSRERSATPVQGVAMVAVRRSAALFAPANR